MKKLLLCAAVSLAMVFAFTACGSSSTGAADEETTAAAEVTEETTADNSGDEGEIINSWTSGENSYHFIKYAEPLYDDVSEEDGHRTYKVYIEELDGSEETVWINFYFADFGTEGLDVTRDFIKESLVKNSDIDADHIKDQTIDGEDAIRYVSTVEDRETVTTAIFYDGDYVDVSVYSTRDEAPSDTAKEIYQAVINSITIEK